MQGTLNESFILGSIIAIGAVSSLSMPIYNAMNAGIPADFGTTLIIAHRGASAVAPENTRSSIAEAIRVNAPVIEFDVRATSDGELVLFHDGDFERLIGKKGAVETSTWAEFEGLDVGKWFGDGSFAGEKPIRMSLAIELCREGNAIPLIEHKTGSAAAYAKVIQELGVEKEVIVQSFNWDFLADLKAELPDTAMGALGSKTLSPDRLAEIESLAPNWVGWNYKDLRESDLAGLHDLGANVVLWTVNDPSIAKQWVSAGADGIITDKPDLMIELFAEKR